MTLAPGTTLGRYQILEPLGSGGMASVYRAYQPALDRVVALKVLRPTLADDPEFRTRFEREAKAVARLRHPHIVQVFDFEQEGALAFIVMEFIAGGTLKARLSQLEQEGQPLPIREVSRIVTEVGDALGYAHAQGIVHRDIKPSNILLTTDGKAVVSDFGIARLLSGAGQTATGVGLGTPEYMSPEQGQGQPVDARADIYSLGVLAYELLTGSVPYRADTPFAVVLAHVRDPLPLPSSRSDRVGPATERALLRALAKDPAQRYGAAPEFAQALARAVAEDGRVTGSTRLAAPAPVSWRKRLLARPARLVPGAIAALLLIYGGGTLISGALGNRGEPAPSAAPSSDIAANAVPGAVATATLLPRSASTAGVATSTTPTLPQTTATLPPTATTNPLATTPTSPLTPAPIAAPLATATLPPPTAVPPPAPTATPFVTPDPNGPKFALTGRVTSTATGAALVDVQVNIYIAFDANTGCCRFYAAARSGTSGGYSANLPSASYWIEVKPDPATGYAPQFWRSAQGTNRATIVNLSGAAVSGIDFQVATGFAVTGTVTNAFGAPVNQANVVVHVGNGGGHVTSATTDTSGRYLVRLTSGSYELQLYPPGPCCGDIPSTRMTVAVSGQDLTANLKFP